MIDDVDPVLDAVAALRASRVAVAPIGDQLERWQIGDLTFSDADVLRLAESRGLIMMVYIRPMPKPPSPRGARPRTDIRSRVLAALTPDPATAAEITERAGLPGRERGLHAARAPEHLEGDGLAVSELGRNVTRWRAAGDASPQA